ncbi:Hypothetical predicted protein [Cloeon dipterum]|uniref:Uncharacterized protein n=1 Tax=Cloeon dipterum TaxID=197152 RepID=A0A8S1DU04_9INSE|nr:Hypothetical predicted protein [Cloeon dipterum]
MALFSLGPRRRAKKKKKQQRRGRKNRENNMDDELKLKKTKIRLNNLQLSNQRLKDLTAEAIAKSITFYTDNKKTFKLSNDMKNEVLLALSSIKRKSQSVVSEKEAEEYLKGIKLLLNATTRELSLRDDGVLSFFPSTPIFTDKMLDLIADNAKNLGKLVYDKILNSTQSFVEKICKFEKLNTLETSVKLEYADLVHICKSLHNLTYVDVQDLTISDAADLDNIDEIKDAFSHLKVFLFESNSNLLRHSENLEILELACLLHIPGLQEIHYFNDATFFPLIGDENTNWPLESTALQSLRTHPIPGAPYHESFPNVKNLTVHPNWKKTDIDQQSFEPLLHFSRLERLKLTSLSAIHISKFVESYGDNLLVLAICGQSSEVIDLNEISSSCPNLESLQISYYFSIDDSSDSNRNHLFPKLKKFIWVTTINKTRLSRVLSWPMLEKIDIISQIRDYFSLDDLRECADLISNGSVLTRLKTLYFTLHISEETGCFGALSGLLKNACAFLPNLTKVKLYITAFMGDTLAYYYETPVHLNEEGLVILEDPNLRGFLSLLAAYENLARI